MPQWLFTLNENFVWQSPIVPKHAAVFSDALGRTWLTISADGLITVAKGYAWNGCSPTLKLLDWGYLGTPNGTIEFGSRVSKTHYASLIHDALYQFMEEEVMPYDRKQMDQLFLQLLRESNFSLRYPYYIALRLLGRPYLVLNKLIQQWRQAK